MSEPVIRRCPDGHYRKVVYDLAGFIADYPEQVALAGTVSGWCPKSVFHIYLMVQLSYHLCQDNRCTAIPSDIDGFRGRRTRAFTDELLDTLDSKTLWDEYGIDDDILVCTKVFIMLFSD